MPDRIRIWPRGDRLGMTLELEPRMVRAITKAIGQDEAVEVDGYMVQALRTEASKGTDARRDGRVRKEHP